MQLTFKFILNIMDYLDCIRLENQDIDLKVLNQSL